MEEGEALGQQRSRPGPTAPPAPLLTARAAGADSPAGRPPPPRPASPRHRRRLHHRRTPLAAECRGSAGAARPVPPAQCPTGDAAPRPGRGSPSSHRSRRRHFEPVRASHTHRRRAHAPHARAPPLNQPCAARAPRPPRPRPARAPLGMTTPTPAKTAAHPVATPLSPGGHAPAGGGWRGGAPVGFWGDSWLNAPRREFPRCPRRPRGCPHRWARLYGGLNAHTYITTYSSLVSYCRY